MREGQRVVCQACFRAFPSEMKVYIAQEGYEGAPFDTKLKEFWEENYGIDLTRKANIVYASENSDHFLEGLTLHTEKYGSLEKLICPYCHGHLSKGDFLAETRFVSVLTNISTKTGSFERDFLQRLSTKIYPETEVSTLWLKGNPAFPRRVHLYNKAAKKAMSWNCFPPFFHKEGRLFRKEAPSVFYQSVVRESGGLIICLGLGEGDHDHQDFLNGFINRFCIPGLMKGKSVFFFVEEGINASVLDVILQNHFIGAGCEKNIPSSWKVSEESMAKAEAYFKSNVASRLM